jgi:hypothetical protein
MFQGLPSRNYLGKNSDNGIRISPENVKQLKKDTIVRVARAWLHDDLIIGLHGKLFPEKFNVMAGGDCYDSVMRY